MESTDRHIGREILARNLRLLRSERRLSQEALAEKVGLTQTYLSQVEGGRRNISIDNISALARSLGISISELLREWSGSVVVDLDACRRRPAEAGPDRSIAGRSMVLAAQPVAIMSADLRPVLGQSPTYQILRFASWSAAFILLKPD